MRQSVYQLKNYPMRNAPKNIMFLPLTSPMKGDYSLIIEQDSAKYL